MGWVAGVVRRIVSGCKTECADAPKSFFFFSVLVLFSVGLCAPVEIRHAQKKKRCRKETLVLGRLQPVENSEYAWGTRLSV